MQFDGADDPTCQSTFAMLLASGDNIEIEEFTRRFGLTPTETGKAGDCSCWQISSASSVTSTNAERHIHWILDQIAGKKAEIDFLKREKRCQVDLGCEWQPHLQSDCIGPLIMAPTLRRIADFDLNLILYFRR
jgi:hypothetical protein